jgi:two-component system sensor histidine kinase/response regulator
MQERILVVDDEPENLIVIEAVLEDEWEVFTAESAAEALEILREQRELQEPIDLIITDQRMPGMTGVELLSEVSGAFPDMVRMILTGYSDVDPIVTAVNEGSVSRFLLKPWDGEELRAAISEGLQFKAHQVALRAAVDQLVERRAHGQQVFSDLKRTQDQFVAAERLSTLGRLTAGITHDIRNQLSALLFMVNLVQSETTNPEMLESAQTAYDTLRSLRLLISDVNEFAQQRSIEVNLAQIATRTFLEDSLSLFQLESGGEARHRNIEVADDLRHINIDENRLRQALVALLRNADSATEPRHHVTIRAARGANGPYIEIVDTGIGMSTDVLAQATVPFFSAFEPPRLGMGLGIAQLVAQAHGGTLELRSSQGHGTTARIWLAKDNETEVFD